jgi:hypothetical protein
MAYELYKSNIAAKRDQVIVVPDGEKNDTDTSLTFIGKGAPSFGIAVNQDFLYLLENFANDTPPLHPTEGQLWYDTSEDTLTGKKVKVFDSTVWKPINGLWQQDSAPETPERGDVWVDTSKSQLYIRTGSSGTATNWTLVGPAYSNVLKTGSYADEILDNKGGRHRVIKNYIDDNVVEIIASEDFFPQPPITGFPDGLHPGLNLSSTYNGKLNATAVSADALTLVNGTTVSGDELVRTNVNSTINATLSVNTIQIGQSSSNGTTTPWSISQYLGRDANITNPVPGGKIVLAITTPEILGALPNNILTLGSTNVGPGVGINLGNSSPTAELDVKGTAKVSAVMSATNVVSTNDATFHRNVTVRSISNLHNTFNTGTLFIGTVAETASRSAILPQTVGDYAPNIGAEGQEFGTVFADNFKTGAGNFIGNLTGGASRLTNTSTWRIQGQVEARLFKDAETSPRPFSGEAGVYSFNATLTNAAIVGQTLATDVADNDLLLISQTASSGDLRKVTKSTFLKDLAAYKVPTGAIMPYAGPSDNVPDGWLLCDGSLVDQGIFPDLYSIIKYTYGKGSVISQFRLPDLRSRVLMGFDDMSNVRTQNGQAVLVPSAPTAGAGRTTQDSPPYAQSYALGSTGPLTGQITGGASGFTDLSVTNNTDAAVDTALHFHGLNYIIKT